MQVLRVAALIMATTIWAGVAACADSGAVVASTTNTEAVETPAPLPATSTPEPLTENLTDSCVDEFHPSLDYFPDKATLEFAQNFSVQYHDHYKVLIVNEPYPGGAPERYILVQCGAPLPQLGRGFENATVIEVPISKIFTGSTTHLPVLSELGRIDSLTGVAQAGYISSVEVLEMIDQGDVIEFAPTFTIDTELVIEAAPDVLLSSGIGPSDAPEALKNAGIHVVWNGEWLETTPLGRAEWVKMVALLFNEEKRAADAFEGIASDYLDFVTSTGKIADEDRPSVMTGVEFGGIFYASGGKSFAAQLINDAGGDYVWSDDEGTSAIETDIESQLDRAGDADHWINGGAFWMSLQDVADADERYTEFAAFKNGQVWANNLAMNEAGANNYFELGVLRPDLVLADLVSILHPELNEGHELRFYRKLQR